MSLPFDLSPIALVALLTGLSALLTGGMAYVWRRGRGRRWVRRLAGAGVALGLAGALAGVGATGYAYWLGHRGQPAAVRIELGPGVTLAREVRQAPRPLVICVATLELGTPGLRIVMTPGDSSGGKELVAKRTSTFLREHALRLAINGSFFDPFRSEAPWDYYPREGDPVDVFGLCATEGKIYSTRGERYLSLNISRAGEASIITVDDEDQAWNAISGQPLNLTPGAAEPDDTPDLQPRTAVGIDREANTLILMTIDGRQPGYSEGVTLVELGRLMAERGADEALNMDGGGSTTMVYATDAGRVRFLNSPIQTRIPGRERPVANHIGVTWEGN